MNKRKPRDKECKYLYSIAFARPTSRFPETYNFCKNRNINKYNILKHFILENVGKEEDAVKIIDKSPIGVEEQYRQLRKIIERNEIQIHDIRTFKVKNFIKEDSVDRLT